MPMPNTKKVYKEGQERPKRGIWSRNDEVVVVFVYPFGTNQILIYRHRLLLVFDLRRLFGRYMLNVHKYSILHSFRFVLHIHCTRFKITFFNQLLFSCCCGCRSSHNNGNSVLLQKIYRDRQTNKQIINNSFEFLNSMDLFLCIMESSTLRILANVRDVATCGTNYY